jgi:short-subunit dehydrogenase involved in D-alanine esterification of teichoic acids
MQMTGNTLLITGETSGTGPGLARCVVEPRPRWRAC